MARPSLAARTSIAALSLAGLSLGALSTVAPGCGGGGGHGGGPDGTTSPVPPAPGSVPYSVAYVRQPRHGDDQDTMWPEVFHPARFEPGADLMLLHPDGTEEVLVAGGNGSVTDPMVSFDGAWVYYAYVADLRPQSLNGQRGDLPYSGSDIYRVRVSTRAVERLTRGEFTPNTGAGTWDESNPVDPAGNVNRLGYGILNLGPCPLAGGKVAFASNRNGFEPPKGYTNPTLQLFVMDEDGGNVTAIAPMTIGSALHPTPMADGRLMFSSYESQGLRDQRMWGVWSIAPDGRAWKPVVSAFHEGQAFHFMTQLSGGDVVVTDYYNLNNNGFGALFRVPPPPSGTPAFHSAFPAESPPIDQTVGAGYPYPFRMPFTPVGFQALTPFTHPQDEASPVGSSGARVGKFTHPSAAPANDCLVVWSGGPANLLDRPTTRPAIDSGIYVMRGGGPIGGPEALVLLKNDPAWNEAWPRAVVPWKSIHGVDEPPALPWLPNDGTVSPELPAGTPYGLVGSSSLWKRESFPGIVTSSAASYGGLDVFNTYENGQSGNWFTQGADAGKYANSDVYAIRIVALEPNTHRSYGPSAGRRFVSHASERMRILGEILVEKRAADGSLVRDLDGAPDTSFLAKIPADTPFTFQTIDRRGMVLNMAQTWHQVRPGEMRADCGGCHAHSQAPMRFEDTAASRAGYHVYDLSKTTPILTVDGAGATVVREVAAPVVDVEFLRDVRPILSRSCVPCHTKTAANAPGRLVLDDLAQRRGVPGDYARLADDAEGTWGHPALVQPYGWRQTNASRYVRMFQSRRSLLVWKLFGERLDGWTNADHPTETVPGDASTLPSGANVNEADLDYLGTAMPPPNSGVPALSEDEKRTVARWIDLGCPVDLDPPGTTPARGWFLDDQRPCLTVSSPRAGSNPSPLSLLRVGASDGDSGVDWASLSIKADLPLAGRAAGAELADLAAISGDGIRAITLSPPLLRGARGTLSVSVRDVQGNVTRAAVRFSVD